MALRLASVVPLALSLFCLSSLAQQSPMIHFNGDAASPRFELRGWNAPSGSSLNAPDWRSVFAVFVDQAAGDVPPLLGSYELRDAALIFTPRYPLQPGLAYRARYRPRQDGSGGEGVSKTFAIPNVHAGPRTFVEQVYPTADRVPENLLKLYVHFSAPMSRGEAYERILLLDAAGERIELPFLELDQELWDPQGRRLTLLFDPGRVKRDLLPNREVGSPLREGESYTLVVDAGWPDANGRELKQEFRKRFSAGAADHEIPAEKNWRVTAPRAGTREPLVILFPEPMDQALLARVIDITTPAGSEIAGTIEIDEHETRWRFRPDEPWKAGGYWIDAATVLEDLAGNTLVRPFEVDVFEKVEDRVERVSRTVRFSVGP